MVRFQKSIAGAVEVALGNAPYKIAIALRSAFGIALFAIVRDIHYSLFI
jgi:hypothetical protein